MAVTCYLTKGRQLVQIHKTPFYLSLTLIIQHFFKYKQKRMAYITFPTYIGIEGNLHLNDPWMAVNVSKK